MPLSLGTELTMFMMVFFFLAGHRRCLALSSLQETTTRNSEEAESVDSARGVGGSP